MNASCLYDADCPGNLACYTNVSWFTANPLSTDGCLCSTYYGFSGSSCDQVLGSNTSKFWLGSGIVNIVAFTVLILLSIFELGRLWAHKLIGPRAEFVGILQVLIAAIFAFINQVGWVWGSQTPSVADQIPFNDPKRDKETLYHGVWQAFLALSGVSTCIACVTIALVWIDVAQRAFKLSRGGNGGTLINYRYRIVGFQLFFVIAVIVPIALQLAYVSLAVSFLFQLIIMVFYIAGNIMMHRVISWLASNTSTQILPYTAVLKEMTRTTVGICISSILVVVASSVELISMINGWKEVSLPDPAVAASVVAAQLMSFGAVLLQGFTLAFLHRCIDRRIRKKDTSSHVVAAESPGGPPVAKEAS